MDDQDLPCTIHLQSLCDDMSSGYRKYRYRVDIHTHQHARTHARTHTLTHTARLTALLTQS